jgi:hypothetical protein
MRLGAWQLEKLGTWEAGNLRPGTWDLGTCREPAQKSAENPGTREGLTNIRLGRKISVSANAKCRLPKLIAKAPANAEYRPPEGSKKPLFGIGTEKGCDDIWGKR